MQLRDERKRKRIKKINDMKPGAHRAIVEGLHSRKTPGQVMREEYNRRKYEREQRHKK